MNECPYIVGNECDIAKCEEFHVSRKEKIELLDKVAERIDKALTDDDSTYKEISNEWDKGTFMGCVLAVIEDMKAEVSK